MIQSAGRLFASHYQILVCDDTGRSISDEENWNELSFQIGFAGNLHCRLVGTEADLNDHWIELIATQVPPNLDDWERVTCVNFVSESGLIHIMSVVDDIPTTTAEIGKGDFTLYFAGQNLGVDQLSLGEKDELTDEGISKRNDLEWYRIYVVPGLAMEQGRIKDEK